MASPVILVIDDEENMLLLFRQVLEKEGCTVETALEGQKALHIASERSLDLIIADLNMPGMNGIEVFRRMKLLQPEVLFIVLT